MEDATDPLLSRNVGVGVGVGVGVSSGHIRSLILEKEKELHDINEYRIRTLEGLLKEKEAVASNYKQKFNQLQEDFKYNLKLLEGRDEELAAYDANFAALKNLLRDREAEVSELKAQAADLMEELKQEKKKTREQETFFQQKLKDARAQMEGARWNFDDELRRQKDEIENVKRQTERQLREKEEDLETQRRELSITFDEVMRNREKEFQTQWQQQLAVHKELELKLKNTTREAESVKTRNDELKNKLERLQQELCDAEKQTRALEWQLNDLRSVKDGKITELEQEITMLQEVKQELLDEYESKMAELLQSLHAVEKAFAQQKSQFDDELKRVAKRKDDDKRLLAEKHDVKLLATNEKLHELQQELEQAIAAKKQLEWDKQDQLLDKQNQLDMQQHELDELHHQLGQQQKQVDHQVQQLTSQLQSLGERYQQTSDLLGREKALTKSLQRELDDEKERVEAIQKKLVTESLRWETLAQEQQQEATARMELRLRDMQQLKEKAQLERVAVEEKLAHAESECSRLRNDLFAVKTNSKALSDTLTLGVNGAMNEGGGGGGGRRGAPTSASPIWSDDHGFVGLSPLLSESPVLTRNGDVASSRGGATTTTPSELSPTELAGASSAKIASLERENARLEAIIRSMRDAVAASASAQAAAALPDTNSPERSQLHEAKLRILTLEQELAACKGELAHTTEQLALKSNQLELVQQEVESLRAGKDQQQQQLQANRVALETQLASLQQQLASSKSDVERLLKERTQLMELSNQLTSDLRQLRETSPPVPTNGDFAGKKDYENLVADLTHQLEESRLHNKTLKKELRRMLKLQVIASPAMSPGSASSSDTFTFQRDKVSPAASNSSSMRRRSSTLEMLQGLERNSSTSSNLGDVSQSPAPDPTVSTVPSVIATAAAPPPPSASSVPPPPLTIDLNNPIDLRMEILRTKLAQAEEAADANAKKKPARRATGQVQELQQFQNGSKPVRRATGQSSEPKSNSKLEAVHETEEETEETRYASAPPSLTAANTMSSPSLMQTFFGNHQGRDRDDSLAPVASDSNASKVTDARLKLKQAKEMLELVGRKAERAMSMPTNAAEPRVATRSSDRTTSSQKTAMQKLKDLQTKRAEMVQERRKVRNYSMMT